LFVIVDVLFKVRDVDLPLFAVPEITVKPRGGGFLIVLGIQLGTGQQTERVAPVHSYYGAELHYSPLAILR
jgi:hypothetical protein